MWANGYTCPSVAQHGAISSPPESCVPSKMGKLLPYFWELVLNEETRLMFIHYLFSYYLYGAIIRKNQDSKIKPDLDYSTFDY